MPRSVQVNAGQKNVSLPNGGRYDGVTTVLLTDAEFASVPGSAFSSGTLTDLGPAGAPGGDEVFDRVAAPPVTSAAAVAAPTKAEFDALRTDLLALRTALTGNGRPLQ